MTTSRATTGAAGILLGALLLAGCAQGSGGGARTSLTAATPLDPAPLATVHHGNGSLVTQAEDVLVTDQASFDALWRRHSHLKIYHVFDFQTQSVIATFRGRLGAGDYRTEIVRIDENPQTGDLHVTVRDRDPGPWVTPTGQNATPFHLVSTKAPLPGAQLVMHRQRELDTQELLSGPVSPVGANDPTFAGAVRVFHDRQALEPFWRQHTSRNPVPTVDYTQEMVLAVIAPYQASAGNTLEILQVIHDPLTQETRIDYVMHAYRGGTPPPARSEAPFVFLRAPLVPGTARFERRVALPVTELSMGQDAAHQGGEEVTVIRDARTFAAMLQVQIGQAASATIPTPDFDTEQVVAAFFGEVQMIGRTIVVAQVKQLEDGEIDIEVKKSAPVIRPIQQRHSPYHLVKLPRTFGPARVRVVDVTPVP